MKYMTSIVVGIFLVMPTAAMSQSAEERAALDRRSAVEVNFCLDRGSDQIPALSPNRGVCAQVAGLATILTQAGRPDLAARIVSLKQYEAGDYAVQLACVNNSLSNAGAAALIMACQCHNPPVYDFVRDNQGSINAALRARGGC